MKVKDRRTMAVIATVIVAVSILQGIAPSTAEQTDLAVQLTTHPAEDYGPDWSPDGRIAFTSNRLGWDAGKGSWYHMDIWVMDQDGTNERPVTNSPYRDCEPSWSPDGTQVVFCRTDQSWTSTDDDIWIVDADIGEPSAYEIFTYGDDQDPDWSPDGTKIAFNGARGWEIFAITPLGTELIQVTDFPGTSPVDWPDWSPDGSKIAFVYYVDWNPDLPSIWVVDSDKTYAGMDEATMLTDNGDHPAWSPDGTKIAFSSKRSGNWDIWVMNADGTNPVQITTDPADDRRPTWSPDGTGIVFQSNRAGNLDIWVIPLVTYSLTVSTDKSTYIQGEIITIIGRLISEGEPIPDATVGIEVLRPDNATIWVEQVTTNSTGHFESRFTLPSDAPFGEYTVIAVYGGVIAACVFKVEAEKPPFPILILDVTTQKQDGTPSKEFKQGDFVFVNVTFMNVWKEQVKDTMIIARVTDPDLTPVFIGITIQTIGAGEKGQTLLGFTLEQNAIVGTYLARVFVWNTWPKDIGWTALSEPRQITFQVIEG